MKPEYDSVPALRDGFASGALSGEEAARKLSAAIEAEYQQEQPRMDFINACEDLLWELGTEGAMPFVSRVQEDKAFIQEHAQPTHSGHAWPLWLRGLTAAAALVVVVVLATVQIRLNWMSGQSIDGGERYLITGHHVDLSVVQSAIADHAPNEQLNTESLEEAIAFLGFAPLLPDMSGFDAQRTVYSLHVTEDYISLDVLYEFDPLERNIVYSVTWYTNAEYAYIALEQSGEGNVERIAGQDVYVYMNINRPGFAWSDGLTVYLLSGGMTMDEGRQIIENILYAP